MGGQDVESNRRLVVGRVNQHHIIDAFQRDTAQNFVHQITVRIKHRHAFTVLNVLPDEIEKQRGLARATGSDDVAVPYPLFGGQPHVNRFASVGVATNQNATVADNGRSRLCLACLTLQDL